ncbi:MULTISPECIES: pyridoxamine 5'-phosphate oxidase family protein [unclassified Streptomyces]|uniref:pyridoxamine 5'-phosphate oxidase family protein n=1 Tax=unclassified Streptomyces TaxID=2593676 RepID=UPI0004CAA953|nr:pyridoxamine 5'-phosphate oxidase family protein [Streptomyces sp. NRRL F-5727]
MTTTPAPRTRGERLADTLTRLETDVDLWLASQGHLIPLSFLWDGAAVLVSTPRASRTGRNLLADGRVRLALGPTRDVVMIDGTAEPVDLADLPAGTGDAFAAKTGFDPRELTAPYQYFLIRPRRVHAWREADELDGRTLMRDGVWLS